MRLNPDSYSEISFLLKLNLAGLLLTCSQKRHDQTEHTAEGEMVALQGHEYIHTEISGLPSAGDNA